MALTKILTLAHVTTGMAHYVEGSEDASSSTALSLSIQSSALPKPPPETIQLRLDFGISLRTPSRSELDEVLAPEKPPRKGDEVVVVKNTIAGATSPPEWLEQHLGRTGRVVLLTANGAEVRFDTGTTWFPYTELRVLR